MMSDLPGEITKQIYVAPPRIMRSTRYSLTAQGRSTPPARRLPTGRSSLEKARGWMRLPRPAAGTMPHMSGFLHQTRCVGSAAEQFFQFRGPVIRGVLAQDALAARLRDPLQLLSREV